LTRRPRLIADAMVGRLARWLRLLGYDVAYERDISDARLVWRSRREKRIILTRDDGILLRRNVRALFVRSDQWRAQLRQVMRNLHLRYDDKKFFSRCSLCNTPLKAVRKSTVRRRVPPVVYQNQERFSRCRQCRKIYWIGSHWNLLRRSLKRGVRPQGVDVFQRGLTPWC
jgi:uncharacterized protein with PIN domain